MRILVVVCRVTFRVFAVVVSCIMYCCYRPIRCKLLKDRNQLETETNRADSSVLLA